MKRENIVAIFSILANIAIIASLPVLIYQVMSYTSVIKRQVKLERVSCIVRQYLDSKDIPRIYAKIKSKDGVEPLPLAFSKKYNISIKDAIVWTRHLDLIWLGIETDYIHPGSSKELEFAINRLLSFPDNEEYWKHESYIFSEEFKSYIKSKVESKRNCN